MAGGIEIKQSCYGSEGGSNSPGDKISGIELAVLFLEIMTVLTVVIFTVGNIGSSYLSCIDESEGSSYGSEVSDSTLPELCVWGEGSAYKKIVVFNKENVRVNLVLTESLQVDGCCLAKGSVPVAIKDISPLISCSGKDGNYLITSDQFIGGLGEMIVNLSAEYAAPGMDNYRVTVVWSIDVVFIACANSQSW